MSEEESDETPTVVSVGPDLPPARMGVRGARPLAMRKRLELRELHSSGGIGEVWLARDELLERDVALKRLRPEQSEHRATRARFAREAKITGQLDHPGIVPVYDYNPGGEEGEYFYTMRFVRGRTLRKLCKDFHAERGGRDVLGPQLLQLLRYFTSICDTMAYAHARGAVHRDLKGDNVVVGDFGEVIILDWGLAKWVSDREEAVEPETDAEASFDSDVLRTRQGDQLGTPGYMAPEQAMGRLDLIDARTDVHGLAAILYEILTGRPPFLRKTLYLSLEAVVGEPAVRPSVHAPGVPAALEAACMRGLSKAPDDRHPTAAEIGAEVRQWLDTLAQRKRTQQERERFFRLSNDLLAVVDPDDRLVQSNPAWAALLGHDEVARRGAEFLQFLGAPSRAQAREALATARTELGRAEFEARMAGTDARAHWIHWSLRSLPNSDDVYLVGRDVTELKRSEIRFRGLLESAPDATCVVDGSGTMRLVNRALVELSGYAREELVGHPVERLVPSASRHGHGALVRRFADSPSTRPMGSGRSLSLQRKDGTVVSVEISLGPVRDDDEISVVCSIRRTDVRRRAERTMLAVVDGAADAVVAFDGDGEIVALNRTLATMFGFERGDLEGSPVTRLFDGDDSPPRRARRRDGSAFGIDVRETTVETEVGRLTVWTIRPDG